MNFGIDISQIVYQGTGVGRFTNGLVNAIIDYDHINRWTFFFSSFRQKLNPKLEEKIRNSSHQLIKWNFPPTMLTFFWNHLHRFKTLNLKFKIKLDWFITSDWTEPALPINKATIVHDLIYLRYPETVNKTILRNQTSKLTWVKQESKIIFADSQTTKDDLINLLGVDKRKIYVNYPGVKVIKPSDNQIKNTLLKYQLNKPFFLTVGKLEPRKNLLRLINAFIKIDNRKIDLVITGPKGWRSFNSKTIQQFNNIRFLGLIPDQDLYSLYTQSLSFVFPSLWEGFGYPLVEAMSLGCPIACSKIKPFEEIALDYAIYFNPANIDEIALTLTRIIDNRQIRNKLVSNGKIRAKEFTWKKYYNSLINTLNSKSQIPNKF